MSLRKTYVAKRADSSRAQFRMRVPTSVLNRVRGRKVILPLGELTVTTTIGNVVSFSLRTSEPKKVLRRERAAREALQNIFDAAEQGPQRLDHQQLVALSGDVYRLYIEIYERDPGTTFQWAAHKAFHRAALEGRHIPPPANPDSLTKTRSIARKRPSAKTSPLASMHCQGVNLTKRSKSGSACSRTGFWPSADSN